MHVTQLRQPNQLSQLRQRHHQQRAECHQRLDMIHLLEKIGHVRVCSIHALSSQVARI